MSSNLPDDGDLERISKLSRAAGFSYFKAMNEALAFDASFATDECVARKTAVGGSPFTPEQYRDLGFWYRTLARSFLSYVEGLLYVMRRLTLDSFERGEVKLSAHEHAALAEQGYAINVNRKRIEPRDTTNRLLENFIVAFQFFPPVFGSTFEVDYSQHGWKAFQELVRLRNDITHPKSMNHVLLQPELPNTIRDASTWFFGLMRDLLKSADVDLLEQSKAEVAKDPVKLAELRALLLKKPGSSDVRP